MLRIPGNTFSKDDFDAKLKQGPVELQRHIYRPEWIPASTETEDPCWVAMYALMQKHGLARNTVTAYTTCIAEAMLQEMRAKVSGGICIVARVVNIETQENRKRVAPVNRPH